MDPESAPTDQAMLEALRLRRGELRESMGALERAMAAPAEAGRSRWGQRVHVALVELSGDVREHIEITEGPDGLYRDVLKTSPRLSGAVNRLVSEHGLINSHVDDLLARLQTPEGAQDVDTVRDLGTALISVLLRHRQRGSDLVFEAYEVDIGGRDLTGPPACQFTSGPTQPGAPADTRVSRSGSTIVWPAGSRPAKLSRKQAQRHPTDQRAERANEQPVAPEPATALVVGDGDSCFHRQD